MADINKQDLKLLFAKLHLAEDEVFKLSHALGLKIGRHNSSQELKEAETKLSNAIKALKAIRNEIKLCLN